MVIKSNKIYEANKIHEITAYTHEKVKNSPNNTKSQEITKYKKISKCLILLYP